MEEEKFTFRQKWFPTQDDAEDLLENRCKRAGRTYDRHKFPVVDLFGRWARTVAVSGFFSLLTLWGGCNLANNFEYSKGDRTGMINKVSEKGLFWKTYEGQIALEGITSGSGFVGANVWDFSLDRQARHGENTQELAKKMRGYLQSGTKVKVTYVEPFATWPWRSGTDYLIQTVEPVEKK